MKFIVVFLLLNVNLVLLSQNNITLNNKYAFPSALGFGQNTTGGRGGSIIQVTNLNASGSGSLRAAIEASGARIVVFRVGGTIDLDGSKIWVENPNITIAGETAPGGGILIKNGTIDINTNNVIIRHIRSRGSATGDDCMRIKSFGLNPIENVAIDHCSMAWGEDENFSINFGKNITVQNNFISKATYGLLIQKGEDVSVLNNVFALVGERATRANMVSHLNLTYEMINNLVYSVRWPGGGSQGLKFTVENNVCQRSSQVTAGSSDLVEFIAASAEEPNSVENSYVYVTGNDLGNAYSNEVRSTASPYRKSTPLYRSTYTPLPTVGLKARLLADTGAGSLTSQGLDSHDTGVISNINLGNGTITTSGTFPTIAAGTPYADSNGDGISDTWATTHGVSSATEVKATYTIDDKTIINDAGYIAREIFFAELAGDFDRLPLDDGPGPDPEPIPVKKNEQKKSAATNILNW